MECGSYFIFNVYINDLDAGFEGVINLWVTLNGVEQLTPLKGREAL